MSLGHFLEWQEADALPGGLADGEPALTALPTAFSQASDEDRRHSERQHSAMPTAQRDLLHPIRTLPLEVLGYIFELCVPGTQPSQTHAPFVLRTMPSYQRQPFLLAAVCRRWRQASLGAPRAWAHLELAMHRITPDTLPAWIAYADLVVARSRSVPIAIWVTSHCLYPLPHHEVLVDFLLAVMPQCGTFRLHTRLQPGDLLLRLLSAIPGDTPLPLPLLKEAKLVLKLGPPLGTDVLADRPLFPRAPALRYLSSDSFPRGSPMLLPNLRVADFHRLSCTDACDSLASLFRCAPLLEELRLEDPVVKHDVGTHDDDHDTRIDARRLRILILVVFSPDSAVERLPSRVDFGMLETLVLLGHNDNAHRRLSFLASLAQRDCQLRVLRVSCLPPPSFSHFASILPSLSQLLSLDISQTKMTGTGLTALFDALGLLACPNLIEIIMESVTFAEDANPDILLDFLRFRLPVTVVSEENGANTDSFNAPAGLQQLLVGQWTTPDGRDVQQEIDDILDQWSDDTVDM